VNRGVQTLLATVDRPRLRFGIALVFAALLWLFFLMRASWWFAPTKPTTPARVALDMRLVELTPPATTSAQPLTHQAVRAQPLSQARPPLHVQSSPPVATPFTRHATIQKPARKALPEDTATTSGEAVEHSTRSPDAVVAAPLTTPSGITQARLLSQPLPVLPDDLREVAYQAVAVARFVVHGDGSFDVELVKPTQNPRLNQILLETLRKWRFFPAMENGRPIESHQDVRIHFNVD
jgi:periplasmic protein TonB